MSWRFTPFTVWDIMWFRWDGHCYRDTVAYPDINMVLPITEPYFHCEPGMMIPLIASLFGILVFYLYLSMCFNQKKRTSP
jgi:hypothetical protein